MLQRNQVYKCEKCGNIVEVLHAGGPKLKCCAEAMVLMAENTQEAAVEKHVPVIEKIEGGVKVNVGEVAHPMDEKHYIEWIELLAGNNIYRKYLNPGEAPEAVFYVTEGQLVARAYCNLHGNWKG